MTRNEVHVVPYRQGPFRWAVERADEAPVGNLYLTKVAAVAFARKLARGERAELFIHKGDGQIQSRDSYGHDPERRLG